MNTRAAASVVLVAALLTAASIGYLVGFSTVRTTTVGTTMTVTVQASQGPTTQNNVTCVTSGPTFGVVLRVVANNGSRSGVKVTGESAGYCGNEQSVKALQPATTNSTGWASFLQGGLSGIYYLDVNATPWIYKMSVVTRPLTTTVAILNLTTGYVSTQFCYFGVCR